MKKFSIIATILLTSCSVSEANPKIRITSTGGYVGRASWYGSESGTKTADGKHFNPNGLSAAHRTLPLGSKVRVTNLNNGKSVVVVINDRGPAAYTGRIIDVSKGAARSLGIISSGTAPIRISK